MAEGDVRPLSNYRRLLQLARGGMGYVYLAVARGPAGFQKLVVLKELQPSLADNPEFLSMFLDEARLSAKLNHPNIVQTNEVGCDSNRYFIAMEYLEGQSFARVIPRLKSLAAHIHCLVGVLRGLDYAHNLKDFKGVPLGIVHRDVSPNNVFVTYDGQVKIVDFGIAKASDSAHETRSDVLRGRLAYMAPEQVNRAYDRRADIFSVGVMLWEAIAGERLWKDKTDVGIFGCLTSGVIPSIREAKPDADPTLEKICARALAPNPNDRYASAAAMATELEAYLDAAGQAVTAKDLSAIMSSAFEQERTRTRALVEEQLANSRKEPTNDALPSVDYGTQFEARLLHADGTAPDTAAGTVRSRDTANPPPPSGGRMGRVVIGVLAVAAIAAAAFFVVRHRGHTTAAPPVEPTAPPVVVAPVVAPPTAASTASSVPRAPRTVEVSISASPREAVIYVDNARLPTNPNTPQLTVGSHTVRIEAPGYATQTELRTFERDAIVQFSLERERYAGPAGVPAPIVRPGPARPTPAATPSTRPAPAPVTQPTKSTPVIDTADPYAK